MSEEEISDQKSVISDQVEAAVSAETAEALVSDASDMADIHKTAISDDPSTPSIPTTPSVLSDENSTLQPLTRVVEAILFASQKPVGVKEFRAIFKGAGTDEDLSAQAYAKLKENDLREALSLLALEIEKRDATYTLRETAAGWQLCTRADFTPWLRQMFAENRPARLSAPAMETLAIIAYRQPITRADIEAVRGVSVDGVMQTLLDRGLVRIGGRADVPGRPLLYETSEFFMEHFGLRNLDELPNSDELRKIALPTATPTAEKTEQDLPLIESETSEESAETVEPKLDTEATESTEQPSAET